MDAGSRAGWAWPRSWSSSGSPLGSAPGATAIAIALGVLVVAAVAIVVRPAGAPGAAGRRRRWSRPALAALVAAIPFIASGHVGILGVGLVNDDMASHLLLADWIDERFRPSRC